MDAGSYTCFGEMLGDFWKVISLFPLFCFFVHFFFFFFYKENASLEISVRHPPLSYSYSTLSQWQMSYVGKIKFVESLLKV